MQNLMRRPVAIILIACVVVCSNAEQERTIQFLAPPDGSRLWVDDEHPVVLRFDISGLSLPQDGSVGLVVNGADTGHRIAAPPFQAVMAEVEDRFFTVEAVLFDRNGARTEISGQTSFFTRRALELMEHSDYPVAAESPRADGSVVAMPGLDDWDTDIAGLAFYDSAVSSASSAHPGSGGSAGGAQLESRDPLEVLRSRWAKSLSREEVMQGRGIFEAYAAFHAQVLSQPALWRSNSFLVYRTMDRGLGNQLESLVSAFAMAMLTNRVFLVDSTTVHHLFRPPPGLQWHYASISEHMPHDEIYDASACLDLRWQNPLGFPQLMCGNLTETLTPRFLFVFSGGRWQGVCLMARALLFVLFSCLLLLDRARYDVDVCFVYLRFLALISWNRSTRACSVFFQTSTSSPGCSTTSGTARLSESGSGRTSSEPLRGTSFAPRRGL